MFGKKMTRTFFDLYIVYIKKLGKLFFHTYLLTYLNKDTLVLLKVKVTIQKILKYASHTIRCLTVFMCVFCHTHVENLLKGSESGQIPSTNWIDNLPIPSVRQPPNSKWNTISSNLVVIYIVKLSSTNQIELFFY